MSSNNNSTDSTLTPGEATFCALVGGGLLAVSIAQGGSYLWGHGETPLEHFYLSAMVVGALLGSQALIRLCVLNWNRQSYAIAFVCIVLSMFAERFSYITTEAAVYSRTADTIRDQNLNSPEYKRATDNIKNLERQLNLQMMAMSKIPANQTTNTAAANKAIGATQRSIARAQASADSINVSVIGKVQSDGGAGMSRLIAFLQSAIPITLNLATMMVSASRRRTASVVRKPSASGKKPQAQRGQLRAT